MFFAPFKTVVFDLETGGFGTLGILQIAAKSNEHTFNTYVTPSGPIDPWATRVHGLTTNFEGDLFLHGEMLMTVSLKTALEGLYEFLAAFEFPCLLVAHNCQFDGPRLVNAITEVGLMELFEPIIYGFSDSHKIIRDLRNGGRTCGHVAFCRCEGSEPWKKCNLRALVTDMGEIVSDIHDALDDVHMLERAISHYKVTLELLDSSKLTLQQVIDKERNREREINDLMKLGPFQRMISKPVGLKIVSNGMDYSKLKKKYESDGAEGLINWFSEKVDGTPRITRNRVAVNKIIDYFEEEKQYLKKKFDWSD